MTALVAWAWLPCGTGPRANAREFTLISPVAGNVELETDRDAFTPAVSTVGQNIFVIETSYTFVDNRLTFDTHSLPELLVRYGISPRVELRLGFNYEVGGGGNVVSANEGDEGFEGMGVEDEARMLYGIKSMLTDQNGWLPESCVILEGFTPTSGRATASQLVATYALGWELGKRRRVDMALRYATGNEELDGFNRFAPSIVYRVPVTERWNVHAEWFGVFSNGKANESSYNFISPGTHYLITPDLELGWRFGFGLNDESANFFSNWGLGWRF